MAQKAGKVDGRERGRGEARQNTAPAGNRVKQQGGAWGWKRERVMAEEGERGR